MEIYNENNFVTLGGMVASTLEESHEIYGEKFYRFYIEVERLSGMSDTCNNIRKINWCKWF